MKLSDLVWQKQWSDRVSRQTLEIYTDHKNINYAFSYVFYFAYRDAYSICDYSEDRLIDDIEFDNLLELAAALVNYRTTP